LVSASVVASLIASALLLLRMLCPQASQFFVPHVGRRIPLPSFKTL
jgi:hypothetical protein